MFSVSATNTDRFGQIIFCAIYLLTPEPVIPIFRNNSVNGRRGTCRDGSMGGPCISQQERNRGICIISALFDQLFDSSLTEKVPVTFNPIILYSIYYNSNNQGRLVSRHLGA